MEQFEVDIEGIRTQVRFDPFWAIRLGSGDVEAGSVGLHLAVFSEPFLSALLSGRKTIDARLSSQRRAPFDEARDGDIVFVKEVSGPIVALATIRDPKFLNLNAERLQELRKRYSLQMCADDGYWDAKRDARYASIMTITDVTPLAAVPVNKSDRRGWVRFNARQQAFAF